MSDALGAPRPARRRPDRPLPARPFRPGRGPHPGNTPSEADIAWGVDLYHAGCWWEAHEVFENAWRPLPRASPDALALQALIQLCAARLRAEAGDLRASSTLLTRVAERLGAVIGTVDAGDANASAPQAIPLDLPRLHADVEALRSHRAAAPGPAPAPAVFDPSPWPVLHERSDFSAN